MYALVHKNRVILGPIDWNRGMFSFELEKYGYKDPLPRNNPESLPIIFSDELRICEVKLEYPEYNRRTEWLNGPYWDFSTDVAVGTFTINPIEIHFIKANLRPEVAKVRYEKEILGTTITINNIELSIDTSREQRYVFQQKYLMLNEGDTVNWKFKNNWMVLSKNDLKDIIVSIENHVQAAFDWEHNKLIEIDACATAEQLNEVEIK